MDNIHLSAAILMLIVAFDGCTARPIYSARLIHRFSNEAQNLLASRVSNRTTSWPERKGFGHIRLLMENDLRRQTLRLGPRNQSFVASHGGQTFNYGNDMGWLHYTWIDIGTPNNSFLIALDTGSDMFWVPCDCIECAPLSLNFYNMLDKELGEYSPSHSSSSKQVPCSHELCEMGPTCKTPKGNCPYTVNYFSEDTSSSGFLFEDMMHLGSVGGNQQQSSVQAKIILGCGSKQTGQYLDGIAPDGVMGLGPGDISVPSVLAKSGFVPHSFSFCYDKSYSGRLYFGDQGTPSQRSTSFIISKERAYIVEVEMYCIGSSCFKQTGNQAQIDTGSSFTFLPSESYDQVVHEFHRQANATRIATQGFEYCYKASSLKGPNIPSMKLVFSMNQSFVIGNPTFRISDDQGDVRCLGIRHIDGDIGIIGQNFMMGYRMVFDWENLKLGWSISNCQQDIGDDGVNPTAAPSIASPNPLPANQQQQNHHGGAVPPAVAGRAPPDRSSAASPHIAPSRNFMEALLLILLSTVFI